MKNPKTRRKQEPPAVLEALGQAVALHQQGQLAAAQALYAQILQAFPGQFDALHLLGVAALQEGRAEQAVDLIRQAIAVDPGQAAAHSNLGSALQALGRAREALACQDRALALQPDYVEALNNRGVALRALGRPEEALACHDRALALRPGHPEALGNRGPLLLDLQRPEEALAACDLALRQAPDSAETLNTLGTALRRLGRVEEALAAFGRALRHAPGHLDALSNYGSALQDLGRLEESLVFFDRALQAKPDFAEAFYNRGSSRHGLGDLAAALADYAEALRLSPGMACAHWNQGLAWLAQGDFERGFAEYEWRWKAAGLPLRDFPRPLWLGRTPLRGKSVLLHAEQGLGDTIQFCRYARLAAERGATVWLQVQAELKPLLAGLAGAAGVFADGEALPDFDCHCPLLSLPLAFGTRLDTIPAPPAYLEADPARRVAWAARLGNPGLPRVGLVWSGRASHPDDRNRSIPLAEFARLAAGPAQFVSLQKEVREADRAVLAERPDILHFGEGLADFADTAGLIANLDLVIAVDTAAAHLAAALGKPVWLLLACKADWRWLLDREDSPWYPTMRLFRQDAPGDWEGVLRRLARELSAFVRPDPLQQAIALHRQGLLEAAAALYREILRLDPGHFDALHLLGVLEVASGRVGEGVEWMCRALAANPGVAVAHANLGLALQRLGRQEEALACFDRALALDPGNAEAHCNRGVALQALGRTEEALACYGEALRLHPGYAQALNNRGTALQALGRLDEALACYGQALRLCPGYADALRNQGAALEALKRLDEALASYGQVLRANPRDFLALSRRGDILKALRRPAEALACYDRALALDPACAATLCNRGNALLDLGRPAEALACYDQSLRLDPACALTLTNRGAALRALGRMEEALASYGKALEIAPGFAEAHMNRSLVLLALGDFARGFEAFEWRWQAAGSREHRRDFPRPLWLGREPLAGKTVLLHTEQGLGDTIQFCRYARQVAERGARVVLAAPAGLLPLLAGLEGVGQALAYDAPLPPFDFHCPLLSLPLAFGTRVDSIPAEKAYLRADPGRAQAWRARLPDAPGRRIGLAWSGNPLHAEDFNRSIPLAELAGLASGPARFISLQKEVREADRVALAARPDILHFGGELADFADTAALVANLDLVVAVDTAVAHLAAALGKPVWLLLPHVPDWRWLLGREDSPWYPTMRLFRQDAPGDWGGVIARVARELG